MVLCLYEIYLKKCLTKNSINNFYKSVSSNVYSYCDFTQEIEKFYYLKYFEFSNFFVKILSLL